MFGENNFLYSSGNRLFVNPSLGCTAKCKYCYLDEIGLPKGSILKSKDASEIIKSLDQEKHIQWQPSSTIISFGCYSDPWLSLIRNSTVELIKYFDKHGNRISLSTKQFVAEKDIKSLSDISNPQNLVFLISIPVANDVLSHEKGTSSIQSREKSIKNLLNANIRAGLYIKPVIPDITIKSLEYFESLIKEYKIPVILGKIFSTKWSDSLAVVSKETPLFEQDCEDYGRIKERLQRLTKVLEHSYEIFE